MPRPPGLTAALSLPLGRRRLWVQAMATLTLSRLMWLRKAPAPRRRSAFTSWSSHTISLPRSMACPMSMLQHSGGVKCPQAGQGEVEGRCMLVEACPARRMLLDACALACLLPVRPSLRQRARDPPAGHVGGEHGRQQQSLNAQTLAQRLAAALQEDKRLLCVLCGLHHAHLRGDEGAAGVDDMIAGRTCAQQRGGGHSMFVRLPPLCRSEPA